MQIAVAQIWIIEIFFNNIIEIILPPHRDPENKKPRHWNSKTKKPRHRAPGTKTP